MANGPIIVGPQGAQLPFDPRLLPVLQQQISGTPPNAAGMVENVFSGMPGGRPPPNFTFAPSDPLPNSSLVPAGNYGPPKAPGTGFTLGGGSGPTYTGQTPPTMEPKLLGTPQAAGAGEAAAAQAPTLTRAGGSLLKKSLPGAAVLLGTMAVAGQYAKASENPKYKDIWTAENSKTLTPFENTLLRTFLKADATQRQTTESVSGAISGAKDYFTMPSGEYNQKYQKGVEADAQGQIPSIMEAWQQLSSAAKGTQTGSPGSGQYTLDVGMGTSGQPAPPQMGMPSKVDTSAMEQWLEQARPKAAATEESKKEIRQNAFLSSIGQAMLNIDRGDRWTDALRKMGGAALVGGADAEAQISRQAQIEQKAQDDYALLRAGHSFDTAKLDAAHQNAITEVAFKNAMLRHESALQQLAQGQPKFMGMENGMALYQTRDPATGHMQVKAFDLALMQRQSMAKALLGSGIKGDHNGVLRDLTAADLAPLDDPYGYMTMTAAELKNRGMLASVLGEETFNQIDEQAKAQSMTMPGDEKAKGQTYNQTLLGLAAGVMMNNPGYLRAAEPYSMYARGLLPYMQPRKPAQ